MKEDFAATLGIVLLGFLLAGADQYFTRNGSYPSSTQRGVVLSKTYDEKIKNCVVRIRHDRRTNDLIVLEHAAYSPNIKDLADSLETGDEILFRYTSLDQKKNIGYGWAHHVKKAPKENVVAQPRFP